MRHVAFGHSIRLVLAALLWLGASACASSGLVAPEPTPKDVAFVIPAGTEAALVRGEAAFQFPDEIQLQAGHSVVITNQDHAMHYFFDIPVAPGQTIRKPFTRAGVFVYQGGLSCSISRTNTIKVRVE
jgi:uncharacterized membrane-anchored protein